MRVLIDSNVLFSAIYRKGSVPHQAYEKAVDIPYQCLICEESIMDLHDAFNEKFPQLVSDMEDFIKAAKITVEVVPVPESVHPDETLLRDPDDALILRAAVAANADIIVSGDLDFLESDITYPAIMTPAQFLQFGNS